MAPLTATKHDREFINYLGAAQKFAEHYCNMKFDGRVSQTIYLDGEDDLSELVYPTRPLLAVTSIYDDLNRVFDSSTLISSSNYFVDLNAGMVFFKNYSIQAGRKNIKTTYRAGYIPELEVVASTAYNGSVVIANSLSTYAQPFQVYVTATGNTANTSATVTGTLEDGTTSFTETVTFDETTQRRSLQNRFLQIDSAVISGLGAGTAKITATSLPSNLRAALILHSMHLFHQDNDKTINIDSRQTSQKTESGYTKGVPKEVLQLLDGHRNWI